MGEWRWWEYHVTHFCESVKDKRCSVVGTVLLGSVDRFRFWGIWVWVDICKFRLDPGLDLDLHMSCGKETPAGPNQFESSLLLREEDSTL
jgi:hypothetical protein